ncbi:uncharacterized protein [Primulina eburnea]|uniref:uncharacterized protein n=1 Tax=Primulina eburnea TaxID=1245227 RepID=UPI003C6C19AD
MCMKDEYMFLSVITPGPSNSKDKLDVFLQPLIAELHSLWSNGVPTYDIHAQQNFNMRVALMLTISDFPAYAMLSGWSTAGKQACPHCMSDSDAFSLPCSGKTSWFDNHRKFLSEDHPLRRNRTMFRRGKQVLQSPPITKTGGELLNELDEFGFRPSYEIDSDTINRKICNLTRCGWRRRSIFWELPYWSTNLIRHNLDVMHIEKNFFDNVFNTVCNIQGRTKDNAKSRADLVQMGIRTELHPSTTDGRFLKSNYTLDKHARQVLFRWLKEVRFSDGYVSKMARCIDMNKLSMFGMKSHDCHVIMQRLLHVVFRELLPRDVWEALTELSIFFADLTEAYIQTNFFQWFRQYATLSDAEIELPIIKQVAGGPLMKVKTYRGYCINGFNFHTVHDTSFKGTNNSGLQVSGHMSSGNVTELYGQIEEIIEIEYPGLPMKQVILFKCRWFDTHPRSGTRVHKKYKIVDVNRKKNLGYYEPFVFPTLASQVVYLTYPTTKRTKSNWMHVSTLRRRAYVTDVEANTEQNQTEANDAFQADESELHDISTQFLLTSQDLVDVNVMYDNEIDLNSTGSETEEVQYSSDDGRDIYDESE